MNRQKWGAVVDELSVNMYRYIRPPGHRADAPPRQVRAGNTAGLTPDKRIHSRENGGFAEMPSVNEQTRLVRDQHQTRDRSRNRG